ncbi:hypothetical protein PVAND_011383 [Polypedilum vanderplanki]|uniref:RRM domain-containing protein n=1 Tax=Polypedilum vanderplanki TaxID=319348 RepID=A0A9J6CJA8_POLVA|nr:hypothetical protein PVAND_011383 [Polypedilum vanderplanki]
MAHRSSDSNNRIYVGNLPPDIRSKDVEDLFFRFGKVSFVDLKNRRGPPFAFVEFEDHRDASDAVKARNNYDYDGYKLRVEFPRGGGPGSYRGGGRSNNDRGSGRSGGNNNRPAARRSQYRVMVTGLPSSGSWQDLKDHMREAGDVCFADVYKDGSGVVEFLRHEDMKYAIKKLDDSRFRSHEGEVAYIRIKEDSGSSHDTRRDYRDDGSYGRSRSRSRSPYSPRKRRGSPVYNEFRPRASRSRSRSYNNY